MLNLKKYRKFLTKNERNKVYLRKNSSKGKGIADSKYKTKKLLSKKGVGVPNLLARFKNEEQLLNFRWEDLEGNFVIKPESGYGGEGIIIIRKRKGNQGICLKNTRKSIRQIMKNGIKKMKLTENVWQQILTD